MSAIATAGIGLPAETQRATFAAVLSATIIFAAAAIQLFGHTNTDVSWLLTIGERWIDGETPYVDIIEVNPPASILLYMPAVLLGRLLDVAPEAVVVLLVVFGAVASAVFACRILRRAELISERAMGLQLAAMLALLLLVPADDFAEREHIGLLAILPLLASWAARACGRPPSRRDVLAAALAAGLALAIKPIFGLGLIGPAIYLVARRGWRAMLWEPDIYVVGLVPAIYGAAVPICFPAFTSTVLHLVLAAYVPARFGVSDLALSKVGLLFAGLACIALCLRAMTRSAAWPQILLLSAAGFYAGFLIQGKAWAYQGLPAVLLAALSVLGAIGVLGATALERQIRILAAAALGTLAAMAATVFDSHPTMGAAIPGLEQALHGLGPHPTIMAITSDIAVGHPLVREVAGRWVGSFPSQWVSSNAAKLRAAGVSSDRMLELERLSQVERSLTARDVLAKRPDAILVKGDAGQDYVDSTPALAAAFATYERRGQYGPLTLWVRRPS